MVGFQSIVFSENHFTFEPTAYQSKQLSKRVVDKIARPIAFTEKS